RLVRIVDLNDRRIPKIEFLARNARDQGPGDGNPRRFSSRVGNLSDFEIPKRSADIDDAGDAAADIARECVVEMRLDPRDLIFVRPDAVQIDAIGARK